MEWLLAKLLSRITGTLLRIEVRGHDGFLAHYVANKVEWRMSPHGQGYWVVAYEEPGGIVEADLSPDITQEAPPQLAGTIRLLRGDTR